MECPQDLVASNVEIRNNGVTEDISKGLRVLRKDMQKVQNESVQYGTTEYFSHNGIDAGVSTVDELNDHT